MKSKANEKKKTVTGTGKKEGRKMGAAAQQQLQNEESNSSVDMTPVSC